MSYVIGDDYEYQVHSREKVLDDTEVVGVIASTVMAFCSQQGFQYQEFCESMKKFYHA